MPPIKKRRPTLRQLTITPNKSVVDKDMSSIRNSMYCPSPTLKIKSLKEIK
jgi:hypothetical protein